MIGRDLCPLLVEAGFDAVRVSPRVVYVDSSRPDLVEGFTRRTITAMIEGIREPAIAAGLSDSEPSDAGVRNLRRAIEADACSATRFQAWGEEVTCVIRRRSHRPDHRRHPRWLGDRPHPRRDQPVQGDPRTRKRAITPADRRGASQELLRVSLSFSHLQGVTFRIYRISRDMRRK
jgi:hypothetical protein